jgi:Ala-tRNA(Pro) deacylase
MPISTRLESYIKDRGVGYELIPHPHTESSMDTAAAAHVPGDYLAKAVIVQDGDGPLMVVVPSDYHVHLGLLHKHLNREVGLITEDELVRLFPDCDEGAVPPLGAAYGIPTLVEETLLEAPQVYFESGDHEHLVKVNREDFRTLLADAERVRVGQHI